MSNKWGTNICPTCEYCETDKHGHTFCRINDGDTCYRYTPCWLFKKKTENEVQKCKEKP